MAATDNALLLETGNDLWLETGSAWLLETAEGAPTVSTPTPVGYCTGKPIIWYSTGSPANC